MWVHLRVVGVIVCGYICVSTCVFFCSIPYVIGWPDHVLLSAVSTTTHLHISLCVQPARDPRGELCFPNVKFYFDRVWMVVYSFSGDTTAVVFSICAKYSKYSDSVHI